MRTPILTSATALWAVTACSLGTAGYGLAVSWRAQEVCEAMEARCEELRAENAELRELLGRTDLSITVRVAETEETIPERNSNYLNIHALDGGQQWKGQIGTDKWGHAIFSHPAYSIRAGAILLRNYERRHGIDTIEALVGRFCTGNREEYVDFLCHALKLRKDQKFSITARLPELIRAMVRFETGKDLAGGHAELVAAVRG